MGSLTCLLGRPFERSVGCIAHSCSASLLLPLVPNSHATRSGDKSRGIFVPESALISSFSSAWMCRSDGSRTPGEPSMLPTLAGSCCTGIFEVQCRGHKLYVKVFQRRESRGILLFQHGYAGHCSVYDDGRLRCALPVMLHTI